MNIWRVSWIAYPGRTPGHFIFWNVSFKRPCIYHVLNFFSVGSTRIRSTRSTLNRCDFATLQNHHGWICALHSCRTDREGENSWPFSVWSYKHYIKENIALGVPTNTTFCSCNLRTNTCSHMSRHLCQMVQVWFSKTVSGSVWISKKKCEAASDSLAMNI